MGSHFELKSWGKTFIVSYSTWVIVITKTTNLIEAKVMTDLNLESRKRFDLFYEVDINAARCNVDIDVESLGLQGLNPVKRVLKLFKVYQLLLQETECCKIKDYLNFAHKQSCLANTFYCRQLIYQCDQEPHLLEGLTLYKKLECIISLLQQAKAQVPLFTYADFLKGVMNVVFYVLQQRPTGTSKKDYFKMKNWFTQKKLDCVNLECDRISDQFIEKARNNPRPMEQVTQQIQQLQELLQNVKEWSSDQLYASLSRLLPGSLPGDKAGFHRLFCQFSFQKNGSPFFSPKMLCKAYENTRAGKLSNILICCWSLMKYEKWLTDVAQGKIGLNDPPGIDYEQLFYHTFDKGIAFSKKLMAAFHLKYPYGKISHEQYKSIILNKLKKYRQELNDLRDQEYYQLLLNKENTKYYFINHCFLDIDLASQACQLQQAVVLNEMIKFYSCRLSHMDQSLVNPSLNLGKLKNDFEEIISMMVPGTTIIISLRKAIDQAYRDMQKKTPLFFIVENLKDSIDDIFGDSINNLNDQLDTQPGIIKETYIKNLLMELGLLLLTRPDFGQGLEKYVNSLRQFLKMKLKYTLDEQSSPPENHERSNAKMKTKVIKEPDNKKISYGYKKSPGLLTPFIQLLNDNINFLDPRTTIEDCVRIITSDNLNSIQDKIYLGCKTNEFRYVINHLKAFFQSFNPATIGKSGIFISNTGHQINAANLNSAKVENVNTKYAIDNIFNQKRK